MSLYKDASLVMIPSAYKDGKLYSIRPTDGSGDFTFSRGSNLAATRVDVNGLIEKGRENLLPYSNDFSNAAWVKDNTTITSGQSGYDGSSNAYLLQATASSFLAKIVQSVAIGGGVKTMSIYAKAGTTSFIGIESAGSNGFYSYFDLSSGTAGTGVNIKTNVESVGNGWYRISVIGIPNSISFANIFVTDANGSNNVTAGANVLIQSEQIESGLVATDYIETGASTAQAGILEDMPRLDYSGSCPALLLEPQRINQCSHSEYIGAADWNQAGITRDLIVTQTSQINPEGSAICWKIQGTSTSNQLANNSTTTSGTTITNSIYVKRISGTGNVFLRDVNNDHTSFSLSVADGWKRIDVTATATSTTARFYVNLVDYTDEILVWGAQQEVGSYPTSYIPTYGSSVTRTNEYFDTNVDLQTEGILGSTWTFLYDNTFIDIPRDDTAALFLIQDASGNSARVSLNNDGSFRLQISRVGSIANVSANKIVGRYDGSSVEFFADGVSVGSASALPNEFANLNDYAPSTRTAKTIRLNQVLIFPTALTDSECIALTTL